MDEVLTTQLIQILDKRIAKYSSKDLSSKSKASTKELRNFKLNPLARLLIHKPENPPPQIHSLASITLKSKIRKVKAHKHSEIINNISIQDSNYSINTTDIQSLKPTNNNESEKQNALENYTINKEEVQNANYIERLLKSDIEILGCWQKFKENFLRLSKKKFLDNSHWWKYKMWRSVMKSGIKRLESKWIRINNAATKIQSIIRMCKTRKVYLKIKQSCIYIQDFWVKVYKQRCRFLKIKFLACFLSKYAKLSFIEKSFSAIIIQKYFRMFIIRKRYKNLINEKMQAYRHRKMLEKQSNLVKQRNNRKQAVKIIENFWLNYKEKCRLKTLRKYLVTLPYKYRKLLMKFKQVKRDADNLKNTVDELIAKKFMKYPLNLELNINVIKEIYK
ncbi:hypothetical protein SteCoe_11997 [Stentor coeruleus]|uniref:Uncharacterized protein n=1 Tax=Stentor coeruleus TaxID=5963 RepID=A0A1R2CBX7_9CILI|nr:hypothetical protein SteCoe_11997 [Stentor coeruleus]